jgi:large subunit ribosomal protein L20
MEYSTRDRYDRKGQFRRLWITRINAAARMHGLSYSQMIHGLSKAGVTVDRKVMADLAVRDEAAFGSLASTAKAALA